MAATGFKKPQLIVLSAVILYIMTDEVQTESSCKAILDDIRNCWSLHPQLPSPDCKVGSNTSLVECAHTNLYPLQKCNFYESWEGAHRTTLFAKVMDVICETNSIYDEFKKDEDCWKDARECAEHIVQIPKQQTYEYCQNVTALLANCTSQEHNPNRIGNCSEYIHNFVNTAFHESETCGAAAVLAQASMVLIVCLVAILSR